jgi:prepilin peptidase CpaA
MDSVTPWAVMSLLAVATATDVRSRRIPNWLVLPFLAGGFLTSGYQCGWTGLAISLKGAGLAVLVTGVLCFLRGLGMGDLKLLAAIGAWIGPSQVATALAVTAIAGGIMAVVWAAASGNLRQSLDGASDLLVGFRKRGLRPHERLQLGNPSVRGMPYAPAIAVGTIFSFFTVMV